MVQIELESIVEIMWIIMIVIAIFLQSRRNKCQNDINEIQKEIIVKILENQEKMSKKLKMKP